MIPSIHPTHTNTYVHQLSLQPSASPGTPRTLEQPQYLPHTPCLRAPAPHQSHTGTLPAAPAFPSCSPASPQTHQPTPTPFPTHSLPPHHTYAHCPLNTHSNKNTHFSPTIYLEHRRSSSSGILLDRSCPPASHSFPGMRVYARTPAYTRTLPHRPNTSTGHPVCPQQAPAPVLALAI